MLSARSARSEHSQSDDPQRELRAALAADELVLYFQPIVALSSGAIRGVEALLRWHLPGGAVLLPDDFLPAVAHTPVMTELSDWVIDRACAHAAAWAPWTVSVNVAAVDVVRPGLVDVIDEALHRHQLPPERITVEVTEHAAIQGLDIAGPLLTRLRARGVGIALDDFGTGYSSLLYLRDLPVTEVKIDRTFVAGVDGDGDDAAIVHSVVQLAKAVHITVVAEGVETATQASYLHSVGCVFAQGYRYARPAPAELVPPQLSQDLFEPYPVRRSGRRSPRATLTPAEALSRMTAMLSAGASLHTIAAALNRDGLLTGAGTRWTAATVAREIQQLPIRPESTTTANWPPRGHQCIGPI